MHWLLALTVLQWIGAIAVFARAAKDENTKSKGHAFGYLDAPAPSGPIWRPIVAGALVIGGMATLYSYSYPWW